MASWTTRITNDAALAGLRRLYRRHGYLTERLISRATSIPNPHFYEHRFGGLLRAYEMVGFKPDREMGFVTGFGDRLRLVAAVRRSVDACRAADAELFVNDHWRVALACGAPAVHLGQEDLYALGDGGRGELRASGLALGISTHSLWELCRARCLAPRYIACGPVWPTLTKAMPWRAQGLDNLRWWRRMAGAPVVAIGGILTVDRVRQAAACGVDGVCVVRGLGEDPRATVPQYLLALEDGRADDAAAAVPLPHPSLG